VKRCLVYICILVFSLQVLPLEEIGKALFKLQLTEEAEGSCAAGGEDGLSKLKKKDEPFHYSDAHQSIARNLFLSLRLKIAIHEAEHLLQNFTPEIYCPPPDIM
jgi:hypothetical protein